MPKITARINPNDYVRYPEEESSGILNWAPTVVRGAGAILPGGPIGAAGNALLEGIAQTGENVLGTRSGYNPTQIATQAGIGAIPFGKAAGLAKTLGRGAGLGAGATLATQQAETGIHAPTSEELGGVAIGGLLGAGGAGIARGLQNRFKPTVTPEVAPNIIPGIGNIASRTGTAFEPGPIPTPIMKSGTIEIKPQQFTVASPAAQGRPIVSFGQKPARETPKVETPEFTTKSGLKGPAKKTAKSKTPEVKSVQWDPVNKTIDLGGPVVEIPAIKTTKAKTVPHHVTGKPVIVEETTTVETPIKPKKGKAKIAAQVPEPRPKLPAELSKAKLNYSIGDKKYELEFADDIDRAIYIVGGKGTSKSHQKYKDWLVKTIGMPEEDIGYASKFLRAHIKSTLKGKEPGKISLPRFNGLEVPKELKGEAHEMMPRKPRGSKTGSRMFYHQHKPQVPPSQQIPIPPNKVTIPGPGSGSTAPPVVTNPWEEFKKMSRWEQAKHLIFNEARQGQTSLDLSHGLRQGINFIARPTEFRAGLKAMWESAKSDVGYQNLIKEIETDPEIDIMRNAGVNFAHLSKDPKNLKNAPESLRGVLLEHFLPPVAMSNRGYNGMSLKLMKDTFKAIAKSARDAGIDLGDGNNANAKAIAELVNDMNGRGKLPFDLDRIADKVNNVFFSPKLIASRINMFRRAFHDPRMIGEGVDPKLAKQLRKEAVRSMLGVGGMAALGLSTSALLFNEPTAADPFSTDFGKIKMGKTRIDLTGGYQQYVRAAFQLASGMANVEGKEAFDLDERNRLQTSSRFLRNKLAPVAASIVDWMAGQDVLGEEFSASKELRESIEPLILQDLEEIWREDRGKLPVAGPAAFFGAGVQSYGEDEPKKTKKKGKLTNAPGMFRIPQVKLYQPGN